LKDEIKARDRLIEQLKAGRPTDDEHRTATTEAIIEANKSRKETIPLNHAILQLDPKQRAEIEKQKTLYYDNLKAGH